MTLGESLLLIFTIGIGIVLAGVLLLGLFWLLAKAVRFALSMVIALFGMVVVIVIYTDAVNGSPLARRVAWVILWLAQKLYVGVDQSTSGIPELPSPFE